MHHILAVHVYAGCTQIVQPGAYYHVLIFKLLVVAGNECGHIAGAQRIGALLNAEKVAVASVEQVNAHFLKA